jgi:hypothetical protein
VVGFIVPMNRGVELGSVQLFGDKASSRTQTGLTNSHP